MTNGDPLAIEPMTPQDPDRVGPFRLVGRLGAGGMGVVYAGVDADGRRAAVKLVRPELAHDPDFRQRFAREVSLLHRVSGRCVARVVAADPSGAPPWFATEYIPGPTLDWRVDRYGPMSGDELSGLTAGLAEALVSLHSRAVVHRDLKPANLMLAPDGPKVVDFGIARALDETTMTRTGIIMGSSGWISPENYRGEEVGPAADVYAWGLIVCYAATGRLPYGTGRPEVVAARVLTTSPDTAGVPEQHRELVDRALSKDPADRPSSSELLAAVTRPLGHGDPVTTATEFLDRTWAIPPLHDDPAWARPARRKPREKAYLAGGGIALALAVAVTAGLLGYLPSHLPGAHAEKSSSPQVGGASPSPETKPPADTRTPTGDGTRPADQTPTTLQGGRVSGKAGLSFVVPNGWTSAADGASDGDVCLRPPELKGATCGHGGVYIGVFSKSARPDYDGAKGWANYGDPGNLTSCITEEDDDPNQAITADGVTVRGTRPVGDRQAVYREYRLQCRNGWNSTPRLWWLPQSGVLLETIELPDRYRDTVDAIAKSVDLTDYQRPG